MPARVTMDTCPGPCGGAVPHQITAKWPPGGAFWGISIVKGILFCSAGSNVTLSGSLIQLANSVDSAGRNFFSPFTSVNFSKAGQRVCFAPLSLIRMIVFSTTAPGSTRYSILAGPTVTAKTETGAIIIKAAVRNEKD